MKLPVFHLSLSVTDLDRSAAFYQRLLGAELGRRTSAFVDVWLFGGGSLFRSLAELGLVDTVEVAVIPVLLGEGVPLLPAPTKRVTLKLTGHKVYETTGRVALQYAVLPG